MPKDNGVDFNVGMMRTFAGLGRLKVRFSPFTLIVLLAVRQWYGLHEKRYLFPKNRAIADGLGASLRAVIRAVKALKESCLIVPEVMRGTWATGWRRDRAFFRTSVDELRRAYTAVRAQHGGWTTVLFYLHARSFFTNPGEYFCLSHDQLVLQTGFKLETVRHHLGVLIASGLLEWDRKLQKHRLMGAAPERVTVDVAGVPVEVERPLEAPAPPQPTADARLLEPKEELEILRHCGTGTSEGREAYEQKLRAITERAISDFKTLPLRELSKWQFDTNDRAEAEIYNLTVKISNERWAAVRTIADAEAQMDSTSASVVRTSLFALADLIDKLDLFPTMEEAEKALGPLDERATKFFMIREMKLNFYRGRPKEPVALPKARPRPGAAGGLPLPFDGPDETMVEPTEQMQRKELWKDFIIEQWKAEHLRVMGKPTGVNRKVDVPRAEELVDYFTDCWYIRGRPGVGEEGEASSKKVASFIAYAADRVAEASLGQFRLGLVATNFESLRETGTLKLPG